MKLIKPMPYKEGFKKTEGKPSNLYEGIYQQLWNTISFNHNVWLDKSRQEMIIDAPTLSTYIEIALGTYKKQLENIKL